AASIAKALADEGASVVVNYSSSKQGADRVVAEIAGRGGKAIAGARRCVEAGAHRAPVFRREKGVWPARHPGEQRRRLRVRAARGGDRGSVSQALQRQRPRAAPDDEGGREAHGV